MNLGLIVQQTQQVHAQDLQKKLIQISNKINQKFTKPALHILAFEIMGIAQGIFSNEEDKKDYTSELLPEIKQKIYAELIAASDNNYKELTSVRLVSKSEPEIAKATKIAWINDEHKFLFNAGCKSIHDAVKYIKKNQNLYSVNLSRYSYMTDQILKELQECKWIQHLSICSYEITDEGLEYFKEMPLELVNFSYCTRLTDKAIKYLKGMALKSINFGNCPLLTDKAFEYLKEMPLKNVDFSNCHLITDKAFEYLADMSLQIVIFTNCNMLTDKSLEHLKKMYLQNVNFYGCKQFTDKVFEYLKGMPLKVVNFSYCSLLTDKVFEYLKGMPLIGIEFSDCPLLTDKAFEYLKGMPLKSITFRYCPLLTDKAFEYLKEMSLLQEVNLLSCNSITTSALKSLKHYFRLCGMKVNILTNDDYSIF